MEPRYSRENPNMENIERVNLAKKQFRIFSKNNQIELRELNIIIHDGEVYYNPFIYKTFNQWVYLSQYKQYL